MTGIEVIAAERHRQVEVERWTPDHDDAHMNGELADAAACYAAWCPDDQWRFQNVLRDAFWPFSREWFKPKTRRENLVRAGALIAAEIDRIDRLEARHD